MKKLELEDITLILVFIELIKYQKNFNNRMDFFDVTLYNSK